MLGGLGIQGLGLTRRSGGGFDTDALALFARAPATFADADKVYLNTAIRALKAQGLWTALDALYIPGLSATQTDRGNAKLNIRQALYDLTEVDGGNLTFTAGVGFTGNGTSSLLDTGFNPTTAVSPQFTQNSGALGFWSESSGQNAAPEMGNANSAFVCRSLTDQNGHRINSGTGGSTPNGSVPDGSGFFVGSRTGSPAASDVLYRNGVQLPVNTTPGVSATPDNRNIYISGRNNAAPTFSARPWSLAFISRGLTAAEVLALYTIFA